MTSLPDRSRTALLVIDVQNGVVENAYNRDAVIANIVTLVDRAREADVPVVWVQHQSAELAPDTEPWKYVRELVRKEPEALVHKRYGDAFDDTELEKVLAERKVGHLVVAGAQTDACVRATIHGGLSRGYDVTLVGDAHTTQDYTEWGAPPPAVVVSFTNLYWDGEDGKDRIGKTISTAEVSFDPMEPASAVASS